MTTEVATPVADRLVRGSKFLGLLWRSGQDCTGGWSATCKCKTKSKFCAAKVQWCLLKIQAMAPKHPRELVDPADKFALVLLMSIAEFEAAAVTMQVTLPGFRGIVCSRGSGSSGCEVIDEKDATLRVGPKGEVSITDLALLAGDDAGAASVFRVLKAFPGSRVAGMKPVAILDQES